jgi:hypothetical protein
VSARSNTKGRGAAALGFAPHSGWAALVALGGRPAEPEVLARTRIEMADPRLGGSKQPFHALEGVPLAEAERRLVRYAGTAREMAYTAIRSAVDDLRARGYATRLAGIAESSGLKGAALASILASHALIHTADGDHFRDALAEASARCGLAVSRVRGRDLEGRAAEALGRPASELQASVRGLGRGWGPPWGADQKAAALLAWLLLSRP